MTGTNMKKKAFIIKIYFITLRHSINSNFASFHWISMGGGALEPREPCASSASGFIKKY